MNAIDDGKLKEQRELTVFIDKALDKEEICEYLAKYLPLQEYEVKYETSYIYIVLAK